MLPLLNRDIARQGVRDKGTRGRIPPDGAKSGGTGKWEFLCDQDLAAAIRKIRWLRAIDNSVTERYSEKLRIRADDIDIFRVERVVGRKMLVGADADGARPPDREKVIQRIGIDCNDQATCRVIGRLSAAWRRWSRRDVAAISRELFGPGEDSSCQRPKQHRIVGQRRDALQVSANSGYQHCCASRADPPDISYLVIGNRA